ncbi:MAG TPA: hypothetical protein VFP14_13190 [Novosphingobium sp.]|nr:hypothetical protein [Novosphingobium sp.]
MNRTSLIGRTAVAAALALGALGTGFIAAPALAKEAKAPKATNSPEFLKVAAPLQKEVSDLLAKAGKVSDADLKAAATPLVAKLAVLEGKMKSPLDLLVGGDWQRQVGTFAGDNALANRGLDNMVASGQLDAKALEQVRTIRGQNAYIAKDYAKVIEALTPIISSPTADTAAVQMLAESYASSGNPAQGLAALKTAIDARKAAGQPAPAVFYQRGLAMAYRNKMYDAALDFATGLVSVDPTANNWSDALGLARTAGKFQAQETLDVMRLARRAGAMRDSNDYSEYIQAADPRRSPGEVLKVADAGVAAGKLSAGDVFVTEARTQAQARLAADKASLPALERDARAPTASGTTVIAAADTFLSYDDPAKAEALYQIALTKPGVDADRANTRLGIAQVDQGKYADAQATFAKVGGARQSIAKLWSIYAAQKAKGG